MGIKSEISGIDEREKCNYMLSKDSHLKTMLSSIKKTTSTM